MGRVRVSDDDGTETRHSDAWEGTVTLDLRDPRAAELVVSADAPFDPADVTVRTGDPRTTRPAEASWRRWLLWVPTALSLAAIGLHATGALAGVALRSQAFFALAAVVFFTASRGTVLLFRDARAMTDALAETGADWSPNPWLYVLGGTVPVAVVLVELLGGAPASNPAVFLASVTVVATLVSSTVAGPVYLTQRYRHVGLGPTFSVPRVDASGKQEQEYHSN